MNIALTAERDRAVRDTVTTLDRQLVDGKHERGDQLVTLEIQLPADLGPLEQRLEGWIDTARPREKFGL